MQGSLLSNFMEPQAVSWSHCRQSCSGIQRSSCQWPLADQSDAPLKHLLGKVNHGVLQTLLTQPPFKRDQKSMDSTCVPWGWGWTPKFDVNLRGQRCMLRTNNSTVKTTLGDNRRELDDLYSMWPKHLSKVLTAALQKGKFCRSLGAEIYSLTPVWILYNKVPRTYKHVNSLVCLYNITADTIKEELFLCQSLVPWRGITTMAAWPRRSLCLVTTPMGPAPATRRSQGTGKPWRARRCQPTA